MNFNNLVYLVLDSCRFDSFQRAQTPHFDRLGSLSRRFSYASWTTPSHHALLMGQLPHENRKDLLASTVYRREYARWSLRLNIPELEFKHFLPRFSLPYVLKEYGYETEARVSLPVLNKEAGLSRFFDRYVLEEDLNQFHSMVDSMNFELGKPKFYFFNLGETHFPYRLQKEEIPHLKGLNGALKDLALERQSDTTDKEGLVFSEDNLKSLHRAQIESVEYLDHHFQRMLKILPRNTWIIITADHGECFGESGYFGHGPLVQEKVFEVPFLEGIKP